MGDAVWILDGYQSEFLWPSMFAQVADEYDRRYGLADVCAPQPQRAWTVPDPIRDDDGQLRRHHYTRHLR